MFAKGSLRERDRVKGGLRDWSGGSDAARDNPGPQLDCGPDAIGAVASEAFKNCGDALPAADAHRHKSVAAANTMKFVQRLCGNEGARGTYGMP